MHDLDDGLATLRGRARAARWSIWAYLAICGVMLISGIGSLASGLSPESAIYAVFALSLLGYFAVFLISVVFISMWIHRAHANLYLSGHDGLEFTPGWSVGWFFVPFANLVKPYQAMAELWDRSIGPGPDRPLSAWWGFFLGGGIIENIGGRMIDRPELLSVGFQVVLVGMVARAISAVLLLRIIATVTRSQSNLGTIDQVFT